MYRRRGFFSTSAMAPELHNGLPVRHRLLISGHLWQGSKHRLHISATVESCLEHFAELVIVWMPWLCPKMWMVTASPFDLHRTSGTIRFRNKGRNRSAHHTNFVPSRLKTELCDPTCESNTSRVLGYSKAR